MQVSRRARVNARKVIERRTNGHDAAYPQATYGIWGAYTAREYSHIGTCVTQTIERFSQDGLKEVETVFIARNMSTPKMAKILASTLAQREEVR